MMTEMYRGSIVLTPVDAKEEFLLERFNRMFKDEVIRVMQKVSVTSYTSYAIDMDRFIPMVSTVWY